MNPILSSVDSTHPKMDGTSPRTSSWAGVRRLAMFRFPLLTFVSWFAALAVPALAADQTPSSTSTASPALPASVDLRPSFEKLGIERWQQGSRPTCSVVHRRGRAGICCRQAAGSRPRLSVEFLNWAANQACGETARMADSSPTSGRVSPPMASAPREEHALQAKTFDPSRLPSAARAGGCQDAIGPWAAAALDQGVERENGAERRAIRGHQADARPNGWPVCGGFRWPKREQWVDDVLQMCGPEAPCATDTASCWWAIGTTTAQPGGGVFIFRNTSARRAAMASCPTPMRAST